MTQDQITTKSKAPRKQARSSATGDPGEKTKANFGQRLGRSKLGNLLPKDSAAAPRKAIARDSEEAEIIARIDSTLASEEARADRLLRHYGLTT